MQSGWVLVFRQYKIGKDEVIIETKFLVCCVDLCQIWDYKLYAILVKSFKKLSTIFWWWNTVLTNKFSSYNSIPDMTKSSEYLKDERSRLSAVIGMGSMCSPLNLYRPPLREGIIRTHCPLFVSCDNK